jgi:hypothetical protein
MLLKALASALSRRAAFSRAGWWNDLISATHTDHGGLRQRDVFKMDNLAVVQVSVS